MHYADLLRLLQPTIASFGVPVSGTPFAANASTGWAETAAHVSLPLASITTLVLLTNSLTMVLAFAAVETRDRPKPFEQRASAPCDGAALPLRRPEKKGLS
jgi:heme/copper-type cytochrome/quinol oxidase subunit 3